MRTAAEVAADIGALTDSDLGTLRDSVTNNMDSIVNHTTRYYLVLDSLIRHTADYYTLQDSVKTNISDISDLQDSIVRHTTDYYTLQDSVINNMDSITNHSTNYYSLRDSVRSEMDSTINHTVRYYEVLDSLIRHTNDYYTLQDTVINNMDSIVNHTTRYYGVLDSLARHTTNYYTLQDSVINNMDSIVNHTTRYYSILDSLIVHNDNYYSLRDTVRNEMDSTVNHTVRYYGVLDSLARHTSDYYTLQDTVINEMDSTVNHTVRYYSVLDSLIAHDGHYYSLRDSVQELAVTDNCIPIGMATFGFEDSEIKQDVGGIVYIGAASLTQGKFEVDQSTQTNSVYFRNTKASATSRGLAAVTTGAATLGIGGYFSATGATTNISIHSANGDVQIDNITDATANTGKLLVSDSGIVKHAQGTNNKLLRFQTSDVVASSALNDNGTTMALGIAPSATIGFNIYTTTLEGGINISQSLSTGDVFGIKSLMIGSGDSNTAYFADVSGSTDINLGFHADVSGGTDDYAFWAEAGVSKFDEALDFAITEVSTGTSIDDTHHTVMGDCSSGSIAIALPNPTTTDIGRIYRIKLSQKTSTYAITLNVTGGANIDGGASITLSTLYEGRVVQNDGTQWWIVGTF